MASHERVTPLDPARFEKAFEAYSEAENTLKGVEAAIRSYIGPDQKPWSDKAYEAFASHFPRPEALKKELIRNRDEQYGCEQCSKLKADLLTWEITANRIARDDAMSMPPTITLKMEEAGREWAASHDPSTFADIFIAMWNAR